MKRGLCSSDMMTLMPVIMLVMLSVTLSETSDTPSASGEYENFISDMTDFNHQEVDRK